MNKKIRILSLVITAFLWIHQSFPMDNKKKESNENQQFNTETLKNTSLIKAYEEQSFIDRRLSNNDINCYLPLFKDLQSLPPIKDLQSLPPKFKIFYQDNKGFKYKSEVKAQLPDLLRENIIKFVIKPLYNRINKKSHAFLTHKIFLGDSSKAQFSPNGNEVIIINNNKVEILNIQLNSSSLINCKNINMAKFSPDGDKIVTISTDNNTPKIFNVKTSKCLQTLNGHTDLVYKAKFSSTGNRILTTSKDNTAKIFDVTTGRCLQTINPNGSISTTEFSPNGDKIAINSSKNYNIAEIYDVETGKYLYTLKEHTNWIMSLKFSSKGNKIATTSKDNTAKIFDAETGKCLQTISNLAMTKDWDSCLNFNPDGTQVVVASNDKTAKIYDIETGACLKEFKNHLGCVNSATYTPDGKKIVTTSNRTAMLWDSETGICLQKIENEWIHIAIQFSRDSNKIFFKIHDLLTKIWDYKAQDKILEKLLKLPIDKAEILCQAYEATKKNGAFELNYDNPQDMQKLIALTNIDFEVCAFLKNNGLVKLKIEELSKNDVYENNSVWNNISKLYNFFNLPNTTN